MNDRERLSAALRDLIGDGLRQETPYPVVLPRTADEAVQCVRAARDFGFTVLPLGSGSSFAADFTLRRENVMAIAAVRLSGIERISPFTLRIQSGTSVTAVLRGVESARRTVGGLICELHRGNGLVPFSALWRRVRRVELIDGHGEITEWAGLLCTKNEDFALSSIIPGSRGRLGFVTALDIAGTIPIHVYDESSTLPDSLPAAATESAIGRSDVHRMTDTAGLFQW
jgi:FAD/FMN-containing dehydrogenase